MSVRISTARSIQYDIANMCGNPNLCDGVLANKLLQFDSHDSNIVHSTHILNLINDTKNIHSLIQ